MTAFQKGVTSESDSFRRHPRDKNQGAENITNFADSLDTTNPSSGKIVISLWSIIIVFSG